MKISLNWIRQFTEVDRRKVSELINDLSESLTEVEKVDNFRGIDTVIEIENKALAHRPDCFSHLGIAREIAAIQKTNLKNPLPKLIKKNITIPKKTLPLKVTIAEPDLCQRYTAVVLRNIKVTPSPLWIQERLLACGVKPINNVVDITNFVMLELGQPLHAFDYSKIKNTGEAREIMVRTAKRNERITTLDSLQRELKKEMLVIADYEKAIAIAGVIGGANTEVSEETQAIVIESANFDAHSIRTTGKITGLHTEATIRFERGQDPSLTYPALIYAILLLEKHANAKVASPIVDDYPRKIKPKTISLSSSNIMRKIGVEIKVSEMKKILKRLELEITEEKEDQFQLTIPAFRSDLSLEEDLIEEIARIYGYNKITPSLPTRTLKPVSESFQKQCFHKIVQTLTFFNLHEVYAYSFVSENLYHKSLLNPQTLLALKNPISPDLKYLRNSLIPSLLEKTELNSHYCSEFGLFEVGKEIHSLSPKRLPGEKRKIAGIFYTKESKETFFMVKGILETVCNSIGPTNYRFTRLDASLPFLDSQKSAQMELQIDDNQKPSPDSMINGEAGKTNKVVIAYLGNLKKEVKNNFSLGGSAGVFEIDLDKLLEYFTEKSQYQPLPRFPSVFEDISFIVNQDWPIETLARKIREVDNQIVKVHLKEKPFISSKWGENRKSVTFTIEYRNPKKTLSAYEIQPLRLKIIQSLKKEFQAQIRE